MTSDAREIHEDDGLTDRIVTRTPWWFLSVFLHAALFALCALIVVIARPPDRTEIVTVSAPHPPDEPPIIEHPKDLKLPEDLFEIDRDVSDPVFDDNRDLTNESETMQELQSNWGDSDEFKDDAPYRGDGMDEVIGPSGEGGSKCGGGVG